MAGLFCDEGLTKLLQYGMGDVTNGFPPTRLRLFVNNFTPTATSVLGDFVEMSTRGYGAKALLGSSWIWLLDGVAHRVNGTLIQAWLFLVGTAITIYGYYLTDTTPSRVFYCERFTAPYNLSALSLTWTLTITEAFPH